jgi:hypothetical protein
MVLDILTAEKPTSEFQEDEHCPVFSKIARHPPRRLGRNENKPAIHHGDLAETRTSLPLSL